MAIYEKRRFLIWGKTAPELSTKYQETVCTGAVLEDGTPIRLYPRANALNPPQLLPGP